MTQREDTRVLDPPLYAVRDMCCRGVGGGGCRTGGLAPHGGGSGAGDSTGPLARE